jgi:hypothetical protein
MLSFFFFKMGHVVVQLVESLRYKLKGLGLDLDEVIGCFQLT